MAGQHIAAMSWRKSRRVVRPKCWSLTSVKGGGCGMRVFLPLIDRRCRHAQEHSTRVRQADFRRARCRFVPDVHARTLNCRQPLWMQRELWGPGEMPPGMRARPCVTTRSSATVFRESIRARDPPSARQRRRSRPAPSSTQSAALPATAARAWAMETPPILFSLPLRSSPSWTTDPSRSMSICFGRSRRAESSSKPGCTLSRREIWQIVAYMRVGFPDAGGPSSTSK